MKRIALLLAVVLPGGCGRPDVVAPSPSRPLPAHRDATLDASPKARRRAVPPEVFLRAYLAWFGGLSPHGVVIKAHHGDLFDQWPAYLAALGLPDHHIDAPRVSQSNTVMLATLGRLAEALCIRSVEQDLGPKTPLVSRVIFAFEPIARPTRADFASRFDVLHRTFLGYPAELAPAGRLDRFFALYGQVVANHQAGQRLSAEQTGWAAVCTALVQHPEAELY
jgi:hypothetical protein